MLAILRRNIIALILGVIGLCLLLAGIASATIWKPSPTVTATTTVQRLGVTRPGVLELIAKDVDIKVKGKGNVAIMVGRARDVNGWVGQASHTQINGLKTFTKLDTKEVAGKSEELPDPTQSDMWLQSDSAAGSAHLKWQNKEGSFSGLIYSAEGPATVQLAWHRTVSTPWLWPLVIAGIVVLLLAALAAWGTHRAYLKRSGRSKGEPETDTVSINVGSRKIEAPGRKALRQARERGESEIVVDGVSFPTGLIPVVKEGPAAEESGEDKDEIAAGGSKSEARAGSSPALALDSDSDAKAQAEGVPVVDLANHFPAGSTKVDLTKLKETKKEQK